jgi:predicted TIM-barrel fold metal-dependent hydrolase
MIRRQFLAALGAAPAAAPLAAQTTKKTLTKKAAAPKGKPLDITQFEPKSKLWTPETRIDRAKFPVVDIHTHLCWSKGEVNQYLASPEELLQVMDRCNIRTLVNVTGGYGAGLREAIEKYDQKHPGRFLTFMEPAWARANEPGYAKMQADLVAQSKKAGARGLKVLKTLGLYLRDSGGKLVKVDDARFDPMWDACGQLNLPVAIHVSDPVAFFDPIDRYNERFEELNNHPDWSFHGKDFPSNAELLDARDRVIARHPRTKFVVLHVGNFAENLGHVSRSLDRFPNMSVELGARIGELGRQPRMSRKFFERYQDRILFGTDATPHGYEYPQQLYGDLLYRIYYRFLETEDEYFDYAPAAVPPQGRWRIYGIGLPDSILRKVYNENAARVLGNKA